MLQDKYLFQPFPFAGFCGHTSIWLLLVLVATLRAEKSLKYIFFSFLEIGCPKCVDVSLSIETNYKKNLLNLLNCENKTETSAWLKGLYFISCGAT